MVAFAGIMVAAEGEPPPGGAEHPLEPHLRICDPHHHLWERPENPYLEADFLRDALSGHHIVATVAVECGARYRGSGPRHLAPVGETEFLEGVAQRSLAGQAAAPWIAAGIVAHADLTLGNAVGPVLEAHMEASPERMRGIRCSTQWDETGTARSVERPGMLEMPAFRKGVECVGRAGLSFDAWLYHAQIPELVELARALPNVSMVLDHIGGPLGLGPYKSKRDEVFQVWSRGIAELGRCANVSLKLGGVGSVRSGFDWHERAVRPGSEELAAAMRPYLEVCIEKFGVHRCMFESNFPVDKISYSYLSLWNAFKRVTEGCSQTERSALFYDTAARVYRLPKAGGDRSPR